MLFRSKTRFYPLKMFAKSTASIPGSRGKTPHNSGSLLDRELQVDEDIDTAPKSAVPKRTHHTMRHRSSDEHPEGILRTSPGFLQSSASLVEFGKTSEPAQMLATSREVLPQSRLKAAQPIGSNKVPNAALTWSVKQSPNSGILRYIRTSFANPIDFAYKPPLDGSKPCHWCRDFTYGLLGLGEREVEVIDYRDGMGYVEASGGHVAQGREPSRMCIICALDRLRIIECGFHVIGPLDGWDESNFDLRSAFNSLEPPPGEDHCTKQNHWCSMCINPAFYGCIAFQGFNRLQEPTQSSSVDSVGCGLLLCGRCARTTKKCGGNLARIIKVIKSTSVELRADVEFLLPSSDLYQTYKRKARQAPK